MNATFQQKNAINANCDSPYVKLRSLNIGDCQGTEGFWADKFKLAENVIVPHMGDILKGDIGHAYNNFKIWTKVGDNELYNSGHYILAAIIYYRVTGKTNWLDLAIKHADYLYSVFEPKHEHLARFGFNPSQIMSLVERYRTTNERKYLELADIFVTMRGSVPMDLHSSVPYWFTGDQCQMKTPLREEKQAVGHAVTGMYLYSYSRNDGVFTRRLGVNPNPARFIRCGLFCNWR